MTVVERYDLEIEIRVLGGYALFSFYDHNVKVKDALNCMIVTPIINMLYILGAQSRLIMVL